MNKYETNDQDRDEFNISQSARMMSVVLMLRGEAGPVDFEVVLDKLADIAITLYVRALKYKPVGDTDPLTCVRRNLEKAMIEADYIVIWVNGKFGDVSDCSKKVEGIKKCVHKALEYICDYKENKE